MTPESFSELFAPFAEPYLLVTHRGEIVAANPAAVRRLAGSGRPLVGTSLGAHLARDADRVAAFLASCSRSRSLLPGALVLPGGNGTGVRVRAEGAVVRAAGAGGDALVLLRLEARQGGGQFALLTRQVEELTREMRIRHRVAEERSALLRQAREDRAHWQLLAEASEAMSRSLDALEIARGLVGLLVRELADAAVLEVRLPNRSAELVMARRADLTSAPAWMRQQRGGRIPRPPSGDVIEVPAVGPAAELGTLLLWRGADAPRPFDEATRALAQELARRAALAMHNAHLFLELQQARDELEMQTEELQQLSEELAQSLDELQAANALLEVKVEEAQAAEARAEHARREADASNRAKADFLAMMSHELRTPLNAIAGYAQLLELGVRGELNARQREDVRRIQASQRHLLGIINDILNFARLEAGQVTYQRATVPMAELIERVEPLIAPQLAARGHRLEVIGGRAGMSVIADPEKLEQVLLNLLSNAIKYTEPGGLIEIWWEETDDRVRLHVRDTGIGIAPDRHDRIFEPFIQLRSQRHSGTEGTGLGLAISRELARAMGGDITLESAEHAGSTFTVELERAGQS